MGLHITNLYSELGTVVLGHGYFDVPLLKSFLKLPTVLQSVGHVYDGDTPFNHLLSTSCKKAAGFHACVVVHLQLHSTSLNSAL